MSTPKNGVLFSCPKGGVIIATTRLISMHQNKGKSIAACLADRTDYAKNPDKTNDGKLLSSYKCDPKTVQGEFMLSKRQYDDITGRQQARCVPPCPACHFCSRRINCKILYIILN